MGVWLAVGAILIPTGALQASAVQVDAERALYTAAGNQSEPRISGDRVVFTDLGSGFADIWVGDVNSGGFWNLTNTFFKNEKLNDVDGDIVVYSDINEYSIVVVDVLEAPGTVRLTIPGTSVFRVSRPRLADGHIVYERFNGTDYDVWVRELEGDGNWLLSMDETSDPKAGDQRDPAVSQGQVVFTEDGARVYVCDVGLASPCAKIDDGQDPDINGARVVYARPDGVNGYDVFMYDTGSGAAPVNISARAGDQMRPTIIGDYVAYDDNAAGNWDVFLYEVTTGQTIQVTSNEGDQRLQDIGLGHIVYEDNRNEAATGVDIWVSDYSVVSDPPPPVCDDEVLAFVAQGQIGDVLVQHGQDSFELAVGDKKGGQFEEGETGDYYWENGVAVPFVLSYDADVGAVDFVLGGVPTSHATAADADSVTQIGIRTRASHKWTEVVIDELVFDDTPLANVVESSGEEGRTNAELILTLAQPGQSFVLEGKATLGWDEGDRPLPQKGQLSFQIGVGTYACADGAESPPVGCNATGAHAGSAGLMFLILALLGLGLRRVRVPVEKKRRRY